MVTKNEIPEWLKIKGYLHLSPSLQIGENWRIYKSQIENEDFTAKYAFYPLIHSFIKERKYKNADPKKHSTSGRSHSHRDSNSQKILSSAKQRPLHYASHFDALIYGYYAQLLNEKYEYKLSQTEGLSDSVTAYRKLKIDNFSDKGKSTIHFAKEVFDEIKRLASVNEDVAVLTFDIKGFFSSLDHTILKERWAFIIDKEKLPNDHYNVFKSCTDFSYVLLDDLRIKKARSNRRAEFDEKKLAKIRREKGFRCFFESNEDFRNHIKTGKLRIFKNPFRKKDKYGNKVKIGIPQGLPISAVLANIYLYNFDSAIVENLVSTGAYYRRYSDDIVILCKTKDIASTRDFVERLILESEVEISKEKTEVFVFKQLEYNNMKDRRLTSIKIRKDGSHSVGTPLIYLGFEFRGFNVVIKSTNLAKFYRRLISIIKRRAKRVNRILEKEPFQKRAIYLNQVEKLYKNPLQVLDAENRDLKQKQRNRINLERNERGDFSAVSYEFVSKTKNSNYIGYVKKCKKIFGDNIFFHQIRKRKDIVFTAINKHLAD